MIDRVFSRLFLLALITAFSKLVWSAEIPNGFHGIAWGAPLSGLAGMAVSDDSGQVKYYQRTGDPLVLGKAKLERLSYGFYNGKFYSVLIEFKGRENFEKAKTYLLSAYGETARVGSRGVDYKWGAPNGVSVNLKYSESNQQGYVFLFNKSIAR